MVTAKFSIYSVFKYLFIFLVTLTIVYPMLNIIAVSLSDNLAIMKNEVTFYPKGFNLSAYRVVLSDSSLLLSYWNTHIGILLNTLS